MSFELISFLVGLLLVPFTLLYASKIIFNKRYILLSFTVVLILAILGLTQINYASNSRFNPHFNPYLFLFCPLCSLILLRIFLYFFKLGLNRDPVPAIKIYHNFDFGYGWDSFFYFTFMILSLCGPVFLLAHDFH